MRSTFTIILYLCISGIVRSQENQASWQLPQPNGKHQIGTYLWQLSDCSRKEPLNEKETCRKIPVRVWYPARVQKDAQPMPYLEGYDLPRMASFFAMSGVKKELLITVGNTMTNAYPHQPFIKKKNLPVILLGHGYGLSLPELHTSMAEALASNGYIVLGVNRPYESISAVMEKGKVYLDPVQYEQSINSIFSKAAQLATLPSLPNDIERKKVLGKMVGSLNMMTDRLHEWVKDYQSIINQLEKDNADKDSKLYRKIDMNKIGIMGHSFGGTSAVQALLDDPRVKAAVNLDGLQMGDIYSRTLNKPVLMVSSKVYQGLNDSAFEGLEGPVFLIHPGDKMSFHNAYTDMVLWPDSHFNNRSIDIGQIEGPGFVEMNHELVLSFFDQAFKGKTIDLSKVLSQFDQIIQVEN